MSRLITQRDSGGGNRAAPAIVTCLSLAAAPTFALMAVLSGVEQDGDVLCSMQHASPLTGMVAMYALMSAFHLPPWIKLITKTWRGAPTKTYRADPPISVC